MTWRGGVYAVVTLVMGCAGSAGTREAGGSGGGGFSDAVLIPAASDGGGTGGTDGGDDTAPCMVPFDEIDCAPTLAQQRAAHTSCPYPDDPFYFAGTCGAYQVWREPGYFGGFECVYDSTGATLVTAHACSDYPEFCNSTARCKYAGATLDPLALCSGVSLPTACSP